MGSPFAPAYTNIFMADLHNTVIVPRLNLHQIWLKRFLDDIITFIAQEYDSINPTDLVGLLNECHDTI